MSPSSLLSSTTGVKNADLNELQEIASEPDSTHVYNVAEFDLMHTVVESLTRTVCSRVEEQDKEIKGKHRLLLWTWVSWCTEVKFGLILVFHVQLNHLSSRGAAYGPALGEGRLL
jgi:hypothetical protein